MRGLHKSILCFIWVCFFTSPTIFSRASYDLNIFGLLWDLNSLTRHTSSFIDCLYHDCTIKFFKTAFCDTHSDNELYRNLIQEGLDIRNHTDLDRSIKQGLKLSGMTIYTNSFFENNGFSNGWQEYCRIPNESIIKYAFVVTEWTKISKDQVKIFNDNFDALIMPDQWCESVFRKSGVKIPIFILPLVLNLKSLHQKPVYKKTSKEFVFGFSGADIYRKNIKLLIKAFSEEFKNTPNVSLILHMRFSHELLAAQKMIDECGARNIRLLHAAFNRPEYEDFLRSLSCYVLLSKGEGFSIMPREALAAGIPCILSNNTAHKIICDTGYVGALKSEVIEHAYSKNISKHRGYMLNSKVSDTRKILRDVYQRYDHYWELAQKGRVWTTQYLVESLRPKYRNLVIPSQVILGKENKITDTYLMIDSPKLFEKYRLLCMGSTTVFVK